MLNKIHNADCLEGLKRLQDKTVHLIITDPPYNRGINYGKNKDRLGKEDYFAWCNEWITECARVLKDHGSMYIIHYPESLAQIMAKLDYNTPLRLGRFLMWFAPSNIGHSKKNWTRASRGILYLRKSGVCIWNIPEGQIINDVIEVNLVKNTSKEKIKGFPNQIPEKLVEILMKISSNKGSIVLDPFMGSGTVASVAKRLNRNFIGFELEEKNIILAEKRLTRQPR